MAAVPDAADLALLVVGKGSNLLVADAGFPGLAIVLGDGFATIDDRRHARSRPAAAAALPVLARQTAAAGLTGFEWAVGVPGIGRRRRPHERRRARLRHGGHPHAGPRRRPRTGEDDVVAATDLDLGYRRSTWAPTQVVVRGRASGWPTATRPRRRRRSPRSCAGVGRTSPAAPTPGRCSPTRAATRPAGSSTPPGARACDGARPVVSTKHANFIQADAGGRADDVRALMVEVRDRVRDGVGRDAGTGDAADRLPRRRGGAMSTVTVDPRIRARRAAVARGRRASSPAPPARARPPSSAVALAGASPSPGPRPSTSSASTSAASSHTSPDAVTEAAGITPGDPLAWVDADAAEQGDRRPALGGRRRRHPIVDGRRSGSRSPSGPPSPASWLAGEDAWLLVDGEGRVLATVGAEPTDVAVVDGVTASGRAR